MPSIVGEPILEYPGGETFNASDHLSPRPTMTIPKPGRIRRRIKRGLQKLAIRLLDIPVDEPEDWGEDEYVSPHTYRWLRVTLKREEGEDILQTGVKIPELQNEKYLLRGVLPVSYDPETEEYQASIDYYIDLEEKDHATT